MYFKVIKSGTNRKLVNDKSKVHEVNPRRVGGLRKQSMLEMICDTTKKFSLQLKSEGMMDNKIGDDEKDEAICTKRDQSGGD